MANTVPLGISNTLLLVTEMELMGSYLKCSTVMVPGAVSHIGGLQSLAEWEDAEMEKERSIKIPDNDLTQKQTPVLWP